MFLRRKKVFEGPVEWLIVGLGNPGPEYAGTRHNVGFEVIDRLAEKHHIKVKWAKHQALFGTGTIGGAGVALAKPMTFMNLSGRAVAPLMRQYQLTPERVLIIADEVDLPFGRIQLKPKGGSAGHNGHKSIQQYLQSDQYPRLRIGIGKPEDDKIDHVLGRFGRDEIGRLNDVLDRAMEACEAVAREGLERALSRANAERGTDTT
ncbi:MAG: aminoacyl-tRNA hydrolase [Armatimonadetes bacterium]|nr:aminoacyl-tRNA hydrolase [Armatimonadota bacterium]